MSEVEEMHKVVDFMWKAYPQKLNMDDLAVQTSYSPVYFARIFRRAMGISPFRFLAAIRFYHMALLLQNTDLDLLAITEQVGYMSPGTCHREFKRHYGVPPGKFRADSQSGLIPPLPLLDQVNRYEIQANNFKGCN